MIKLFSLMLIFTTISTANISIKSDLPLVTSDKNILNFIYKHNINALSFSVMKNKEILHSKYYEYSNEILKVRPNNYKIFRIASISKPFTSTAIMQLIQKKKLNLNDKVFGGKCLEFHSNKYSCIKYQKGILGTDFQTKYGNSIVPNSSRIYDIKLVNLLEHTTGTWNKIKGFAGDPMAYKEHLDIKNLIIYILKKTHNTLGNKNKKKIWIIPNINTKFLYSNFGYSLLGRIIEKVSGIPYNQYIQKNILEPLNINTMYLAGENKKLNEVKYYSNKTTPYPDNIVHRYDAHGGWTATSEDLVKFGMEFNEQLYPIKNKLGLTKKSIKLLKTPTSKLAKRKKYAKGFSLYLKDSSSWGHSGKLPGTSAYLRCNPHNNICYSILINTDIDKKVAKKLKKLIQQLSYSNL